MEYLCFPQQPNRGYISIEKKEESKRIRFIQLIGIQLIGQAKNKESRYISRSKEGVSLLILWKNSSKIYNYTNKDKKNYLKSKKCRLFGKESTKKKQKTKDSVIEIQTIVKCENKTEKLPEFLTRPNI